MIEIQLLASVSHFVSDFYVSFLTPLAPYFMDKYRVEAKDIALFITLISFISSVFQILFGFLAQKVSNTSRFIYILTVATVLMISIIEFAPSILVLFIIFIIAYFANSAFHPAGAALVHGKSKRAVPFFVSAGTLGAALGPIFITVFSSKVGLRFLWIVSLPIVFLMTLMVRNESSDRLAVSISHEKITFKQKRLLISLWLLVTIRTLVMSIAHLYAPILSTQKGFSLVFGGSLLSAGVTVGVLTTVLGAALSNRFGNHVVNLVSFFGMALALLILVSSASKIVMLLSYILMDGFGYLTMSSNLSHAQAGLPNHTSFASSVVMGFAWACGTGLRFFLIIPFGNATDTLFYVTASISAMMAFVVLLGGRRYLAVR
ncbi:MFS transporter [Pseudothermotoga sp. U03pept]|uniref:MFS transporter n=1 Tax=Pseudothermotoga sp. U03pept TaxID=3447012 RepID=UPI003F016495